MQSDVSRSHGKVDVSAAVGGHFKYVTTNQEGRIRAVECFGSRECLCLSAVSPLQLSRTSSIGTIEATNTVGTDGSFQRAWPIKNGTQLVVNVQIR